MEDRNTVPLRPAWADGVRKDSLYTAKRRETREKIRKCFFAVGTSIIPWHIMEKTVNFPGKESPGCREKDDPRKKVGIRDKCYLSGNPDVLSSCCGAVCANRKASKNETYTVRLQPGRRDRLYHGGKVPAHQELTSAV